jgi:hypothetical protein
MPSCRASGYMNIYISLTLRAVPMKETSSFYNIGYRTKKVLLSNPQFLWVIIIFSFSSQLYLLPPMGVRHELPRNWWFLPNDDFMVSWCIGSRVDLISSWRNHFYDFCSLSSLITLPCQHFAYVTSHLMRIETIINTPLGLPSNGGHACNRRAHAPSLSCVCSGWQSPSRIWRRENRVSRAQESLERHIDFLFFLEKLSPFIQVL